jgi:hypothetical protein
MKAMFDKQIVDFLVKVAAPFLEPHNSAVYVLRLLPLISVKIFSSTFCFPAHCSTYRLASGMVRKKISLLNF